MLYEASFSGILRIIFWILIISFLVRLVARLALPHVIKKAEQKMNEHMRTRGHHPPRKEGEVTVEQKKEQRPSGQSGDYVDYVEIKD